MEKCWEVPNRSTKNQRAEAEATDGCVECWQETATRPSVQGPTVTQCYTAPVPSQPRLPPWRPQPPAPPGHPPARRPPVYEAGGEQAKAKKVDARSVCAAGFRQHAPALPPARTLQQALDPLSAAQPTCLAAFSFSSRSCSASRSAVAWAACKRKTRQIGRWSRAASHSKQHCQRQAVKRPCVPAVLATMLYPCRRYIQTSE